MLTISSTTFPEAWDKLLEVLVHGHKVRSREMVTYEQTNVHIRIEDTLCNILVNDFRRPNYRFMVAEWLWIWFGHDDVATIKPYNSKIAEFSDDGVTFGGNYGKPLIEQWPLVLGRLMGDPGTRQAILQIFRQPMRPTKDTPCTLSIQFLLRDNRLNTIVNMRSSDVWLGLPYDTFNFTMLANIMAAQLEVKLGWFCYNLGSSHLYEQNVITAKEIIENPTSSACTRSPVFKRPPAPWLEEVLTTQHISILKNDEEPWTSYARALIAESNSAALGELKWLDLHTKSTSPRS